MSQIAPAGLNGGFRKKDKEERWNSFVLGILSGIGIGFWGLLLLQELLK